MNNRKMLATVAAAAAAMAAFIGTATASATVLCSSTSTPCARVYGMATNFDATLEGTAILETVGGSIINTCTGGTLKGKLINPGGEKSKKVNIGLEEWKMTGCTHTTVTLIAGEMEVDAVTGTDHGTLTGRNTEWTMSVFGSATCTYTLDTKSDLGALTGSFEGTVDIDTYLTKLSGSFLCPESPILRAEFPVTEPKPLFVEEA